MSESMQERQRELFDQLCFYTLSHTSPAFIHQHAVDAFTAQHADATTKPIAITFALVGLYLHVEKSVSGRDVQRVHMKLAKRKREWPQFGFPVERGTITVEDVAVAPEGEERDAVIERWCASVWQAWSTERGKVIALLGEEQLD